MSRVGLGGAITCCYLHLLQAALLQMLLYMCCEYPDPPTLPLPGLITDSFGKLRNKEEALKEDMQV